MPRRPKPGGSQPAPLGKKGVDRRPDPSKDEPKDDNAKLSAMLASGMSRLGDGYQGGYSGPQPKGHPVSCSDFIDSMRKDAGLAPFCSPGGTLTAYSKLKPQGTGNADKNAGPYDPKVKYPAGTLVVATTGVPGDGTHLAMIGKDGKFLNSWPPKGPQVDSGSGFDSPCYQVPR